MRLWSRKQREKDTPVEATPPPPAPKRPKSGEDLRKAFLQKLEDRETEQDNA